MGVGGQFCYMGVERSIHPGLQRMERGLKTELNYHWSVIILDYIMDPSETPSTMGFGELLSCGAQEGLCNESRGTPEGSVDLATCRRCL